MTIVVRSWQILRSGRGIQSIILQTLPWCADHTLLNGTWSDNLSWWTVVAHIAMFHKRWYRSEKAKPALGWNKQGVIPAWHSFRFALSQEERGSVIPKGKHLKCQRCADSPPTMMSDPHFRRRITALEEKINKKTSEINVDGLLVRISFCNYCSCVSLVLSLPRTVGFSFAYFILV